MKIFILCYLTHYQKCILQNFDEINQIAFELQQLEGFGGKKGKENKPILLMNLPKIRITSISFSGVNCETSEYVKIRNSFRLFLRKSKELLRQI